VAPGVSAPAAFGVPFSVIEALACRVKQSGKMRVADIVEINPDFDIDNHTARVAARLAWQLLAP
jgi:formiminoglutamase